MEREKDRISLAVSVISKLGGMPTSTQIANWAFEEADETMVRFIILFQINKTKYSCWLISKPILTYQIIVFVPPGWGRRGVGGSYYGLWSQ